MFSTHSPQDQQTADLVDRLRNDVIPPATRGTDVDVKVGGLQAGATDYSNYTAERLPVFIGLVLLLSFLLLMVVFRSLLVPLKAVIMNLLSIGAAYGVIVAVFQWGWGKDLIGVAKAGPVEAWAPMMLFAIVFGLSMDYEVFLLSRMREEYDKTGDNGTAVADGLAATARVITAAALIMILVFSAFVLGDDRAIKLFGFGLAVAVFLDATIVRLILVPATMELLGERQLVDPEVAGPDPADGARRARRGSRRRARAARRGREGAGRQLADPRGDDARCTVVRVPGSGAATGAGAGRLLRLRGVLERGRGWRRPNVPRSSSAFRTENSPPSWGRVVMWKIHSSPWSTALLKLWVSPGESGPSLSHPSRALPVTSTSTRYGALIDDTHTVDELGTSERGLDPDEMLRRRSRRRGRPRALRARGERASIEGAVGSGLDSSFIS